MNIDPIIDSYKQSSQTRVGTKNTTDSISPTDVAGCDQDLAEILRTVGNAVNNFDLLGNTLPPLNSAGVDDDIYIQGGTTLRFWKKISGVWTLKVSVPLGVTIQDGNINLQPRVSGFTITVPPGQWGINNQIYIKAAQDQFTINAADANLDRIDAVFAKTDSTVEYVAGTASANPDTTKPITPVDEIIVTYIYVPSVASGGLPYINDSNSSPTVNPLVLTGGTTTPTGGNDGDVYIQNDGSIVTFYQKVTGTWTAIQNFSIGGSGGVGYPDGVVVNGGIDVSDIENGNIDVGVFEYRLTIGGVQQTYTSTSPETFTGIALSSAGLLRIVGFYGDADGNTIKAESAEGPAATMPTQPVDTTLLGFTIVSDSGATPPEFDDSNYVKYGDVSEEVVGGKIPVRTAGGGIKTNLAYNDRPDASIVYVTQNTDNLLSYLPASAAKAALGINAKADISYVDAGLATKLDASAYNQHYRGKFISKAALDANVFTPALQSGDYAQVDVGVGTPVKNYNWDADDNIWVEGGSGSGAANTDALPEGSTNLYFTVARVLASVLTGYASGTNTVLAATDTLLAALGKLQGQISARLTGTLASDADLQTQTTPTEDNKIVSRHGLIFFWNWLRTQTVEWTNSFRASRFGAGIAAAASAFITVAASTSSVASFLVTFGASYTGTASGSVWGESTGFRLRMYRNGAADDFIFAGANPVLAGSGTAIMVVASDGSISRGAIIDEGFTLDSDIISALTAMATDRATITPAGSKVFYQGEMYDDGTYTYIAYANNQVRRW